MSLVAAEKIKVSPKIKSISVTDDNKLTIKWSKVQSAEKYAVKRATEPMGKYEELGWVKKCEYLDETAQKNTIYWYKITAWKKLEGKKTSTKTSAVKAAVISDIKAPENLTAKADKNKTAIALKWDNISDTDGCVVGRRNDFFSQIIPIARLDGGADSYVDASVVTGQVYHYSVQHFKKDGDKLLYGNFSPEVHGVCLDCGSVLSVKGIVGKRSEVYLRVVAGADGYIIERSESENEGFSEVGRTSGGLEIRFYDKLPKRLKTYYYRCRAYKSVCDQEFISKPSKAVSFKSKF